MQNEKMLNKWSLKETNSCSLWVQGSLSLAPWGNMHVIDSGTGSSTVATLCNCMLGWNVVAIWECSLVCLEAARHRLVCGWLGFVQAIKDIGITFSNWFFSLETESKLRILAASLWDDQGDDGGESERSMISATIVEREREREREQLDSGGRHIIQRLLKLCLDYVCVERWNETTTVLIYRIPHTYYIYQNIQRRTHCIITHRD